MIRRDTEDGMTVTIEAFQTTTGFSYIPDRRPDKRREISPLQLVSFIYYNHGVEHANAAIPTGTRFRERNFPIL